MHPCTSPWFSVPIHMSACLFILTYSHPSVWPCIFLKILMFCLFFVHKIFSAVWRRQMDRENLIRCRTDINANGQMDTRIDSLSVAQINIWIRGQIEWCEDRWMEEILRFLFFGKMVFCFCYLSLTPFRFWRKSDWRTDRHVKSDRHGQKDAWANRQIALSMEENFHKRICGREFRLRF